MRQDADYFGEDELELVQIARRLREAKAVEAALTEAGVEYLVTADRYRATFLFVFPTERYGAFFYVRSAEAERCRRLLEEKRFAIVPAEPGEEQSS